MRTQNELNLLKLIKKRPEAFPLLAKFWEVSEAENNINKHEPFVYFGHFNTKDVHSYPFYKPFSKIIDFSKLDD